MKYFLLFGLFVWCSLTLSAAQYELGRGGRSGVLGAGRLDAVGPISGVRGSGAGRISRIEGDSSSRTGSGYDRIESR